jgi:hypothetical protein
LVVSHAKYVLKAVVAFDATLPPDPAPVHVPNATGCQITETNWHFLAEHNCNIKTKLGPWCIDPPKYIPSQCFFEYAKSHLGGYYQRAIMEDLKPFLQKGRDKSAMQTIIDV